MLTSASDKVLDDDDDDDKTKQLDMKINSIGHERTYNIDYEDI